MKNDCLAKSSFRALRMIGLGLAAYSCLFSFRGSAAMAASDVVAPAELPGVSREMRSAGFWVSRIPDPDKLIMTRPEIVRFNAQTCAAGLTTDLANLPSVYDGVRLREEISRMFEGVKGKVLYHNNGLKVAAEDYQPLEPLMALSLIPEKVNVRYGLIAVPADERLLPTVEPLYAQAGDTDFDEVQNSGLDAGTAVAVLQVTSDGKWFFVREAASSGWVEASKVALATRQEVVAYIKSSNIAVIVDPKAEVYLDRNMKDYFTSVKMGTRFPIKKMDGRMAEVLIPQPPIEGSGAFRSGFIPRESVNVGFLSYTPRMVLRQAFRMLNAPYGWGDMHGDQDCSRFISMVFATFGINMPRNSSEQGNAGAELAKFSETSDDAARQEVVASKAVAALSLLHLKGHIMLYLGQYRDRLYAIHATWAYREPVSGGEEHSRFLGRVVVSDLSLGTGSAKGSLLHRLRAVRYIGNH